jgi:hypothetical protein
MADGDQQQATGQVRRPNTASSIGSQPCSFTPRVSFHCNHGACSQSAGSKQCGGENATTPQAHHDPFHIKMKGLEPTPTLPVGQ